MADGSIVIDTRIDEGGLDRGLSSMGEKLTSGLSTAVKAATAAVATVSASFVAIGKKSIELYADYEQLTGGVETLFGTGGKSIEEYAQSVGKTVDEVRNEYSKLEGAQSTVLSNAAEAYKTAGMSANEYMETVTSFSASLVASLGGDTEKAAKYADRAIVDMSDNANKMGTDISLIQNAYQGFAKQNYTMLDNLKLGYGGTKEEMARLIADASKMTDVQKELGITVDESSMSFGNIVNAISVMQQSMGISGTTAKEAASTISGSLNMVKAAWSNLLVGVADDSQDFDKLISNMVESVVAFSNNILPRIETTISGIGDLALGLAEQLLPKVLTIIPDILSKLIPEAVSTVEVIVASIKDALPNVTSVLVDIVGSLASGFLSITSDFVRLGGCVRWEEEP